MRYYELREDEDYKKPINLVKNIALIKRDCQPYLSQVEDPMKLRRGVARSGGRMAFNKKRAHLSDRTPRGSHMKNFHEVVNDYFTENFGLPFRNGVMTTGDQLQSSSFGIDVAVFPIGDFEFLWSPTIKDLNHSIGDWNSGSPYGMEEEDFDNFLPWAEYQTTDLQGAIESKNEIMIWCKEYYTLDNNVDRLLARKLLK